MRSLTHNRPSFSQRLLKSLTVFLVAIVSACGTGNFGPGSSTKPMSCTSATCGMAVVTMTDATGDFLAYQVTVVSLQLKKADGTLVDTLPVATRVDFAKLVNLTEVVSAGQVPAGEYSGASVTIDYTGSTIIVDNGSTNGLQVAPFDSNAKALGQLTLAVQLDTKHQLEITTGNSARLAFDFNLLASNTVDVTKKTVTVKPVLVASVVATDEKEMRVRGTLVTVDTMAFTVNVQPFDDEDASSKGQMIVHVTDTTTYEVDGAPFTGADGLMKLSTDGAGTMTVAFGSLSSTDQSFLATRVLAGTSVQSSTTDHVSGIVVARVGLSLTLRSGEWEDRNGNDDVAPGDVTVTLADTTTVTAEDQGSTGPTHKIADISVGSRVDAFGAATKDSAGHVTLDASKGHVRLESTHISGSVVSIATGTLTLQLKTIDGRDVSLFTFTGTGTGSPTGHDSDPTKYVVNTGTLALGTLMAGASTSLIGFVAPFAGAPPDFNAEALESPADTRAELSIDWTEHGTTAPFKPPYDTHLDLDISNASIGEHHQIEVGDQAIDLKGLLTDPSIVPDMLASSTLFSIAHATSNSVDNFHTFVDFSAKLKTALNGTVVAFGMVAEGQYDATANVFTARHLIVRLSD
jgi:hypothetical protein